jgi:hypothetical protein
MLPCLDLWHRFSSTSGHDTAEALRQGFGATPVAQNQPWPSATASRIASASAASAAASASVSGIPKMTETA